MKKDRAESAAVLLIGKPKGKATMDDSYKEEAEGSSEDSDGKEAALDSICDILDVDDDKREELKSSLLDLIYSCHEE